ncbi:hypothetical protein [Agrobacterium larrymoorei]|uniref:Tetratricopeptide repeat protein n=1 Tax=Agrobacterium larrymoorei TaxID=160699 RepID=A0ABX8T605_9HYPH|nr:hypothetical protein [Agrobacterium larrymoorei]QYA08732.1 hypothetical protein J5285_14995 [Agrobacterium larrymoorei]
MTSKPEIEKDVKVQIDQLLELSAEKFKAGDLEGSVEVGLQAWELIPQPKEKWDYYPQSLSAGFVQDYVDLGDKDNASKWIDIMAKMYDDPNHEDHLVLMTEGEAMYKLGDKKRAFYVFSRIYEIYGKQGFAGEQKQYLEFYLKEKGNSE